MMWRSVEGGEKTHVKAAPFKRGQTEVRLQKRATLNVTSAGFRSELRSPASTRFYAKQQKITVSIPVRFTRTWIFSEGSEVSFLAPGPASCWQHERHKPRRRCYNSQHMNIRQEWTSHLTQFTRMKSEGVKRVCVCCSDTYKLVDYILQYTYNYGESFIETHDRIDVSECYF